MSAPTPSISPPGYTLGALLGTGSFAEVFLATRQTDNAIVAVKRIKTPLTRGAAGVVQRAAQEYSLHNSLGLHVNIVQPLDVVRDAENRLCIIMVYARGGSAQARMEGTWGRVWNAAADVDEDEPFKTLYTT